MTIICGFGGPPSGPSRPLTVTPYICAWCKGTGSWSSGERCADCGGSGQTDSRAEGVDLTGPDVLGVEPPTTSPVALPRPPAVMRAPCVDCAFRDGSPEGLGDRPTVQDEPFYCHHGLTRVGDGYVAPVYSGGQPVGAFVCAGWWQCRVEGRHAPDAPFRDPGGAEATT